MKKTLMTLALSLFVLSAAFAADPSAQVRSFSGKVEYRIGSGSWAPLSPGLQLPLGSTISTGFDSRAVLEIGPSTLTIAPLTRMTINDLIEKNGLVSTAIQLQVGKIKTQVKKVEGIQNDFVIKSPVATASVRGTDFDFDSVNLVVYDGFVLLTDRYGHSLRVYFPEWACDWEAGTLFGGAPAREARVLVSWDTTDYGEPQTGTIYLKRAPALTGGLRYGSATIHLGHLDSGRGEE